MTLVARRALGVTAAGLLFAGATCLAQEAKTTPGRGPRGEGAARTEARMEEEAARLTRWNWANFVLLAAGIVYLAAKNGGPFFTARSRQIRKDMMESAEIRKEAEERAAVVDAKLANLAADIARLKAESVEEREAETERLRRDREEERIKIRDHAQREIESAGKAARLELKQYAAVLAVQLAEQKIRARVNARIQDGLVGDFVTGLASSAAAGGKG